MSIYKVITSILIINLASVSFFASSEEPLFKALIKPKKIGTYELKIINSNDHPQNYHLGAANFSGDNQKVSELITPPPRKYWAITKSNQGDFHLIDHGNRGQGRCEKIDWDNSNESGISVVAQLNKAKTNSYEKTKISYVTCKIKGPINSVNPIIKKSSRGKNKLLANYSYPIRIPDKAMRFELEVILNNEKYIVTGAQEHHLFKVTIKDNVITLSTFDEKLYY